MKLRVDRFQIGDEAQVTLGRGQGKVRISQQKESAGSLGRTASGGDMTICWTDPFTTPSDRDNARRVARV